MEEPGSLQSMGVPPKVGPQLADFTFLSIELILFSNDCIADSDLVCPFETSEREVVFICFPNHILLFVYMFICSL